MAATEGPPRAHGTLLMEGGVKCWRLRLGFLTSFVNQIEMGGAGLSLVG